jgi:hypothetical protein
MQRLGLETPPQAPKSPSGNDGKGSRFKWQDAIGIVGLLIGFGGMSDMPLILRLICFGFCAVCLPFSFFSHKNWPVWIRWVSSAFVILFMVTVCVYVVKSARPKTAKTVTLVWNNPAPMLASAKLSDEQLNAKATADGKEVRGVYTYNPTFGTTLPAGIQTLSVTFVPDDESEYRGAMRTVALEVEPVNVSTKAKQGAIHVTVDQTVMSPDSGGTPVWISWGGSNSKRLKPICMILELDISNQSNSSRWIKSVEADYKEGGGPWEPLSTLPEGTMYFIPYADGFSDLSKALLVDFTFPSVQELSRSTLEAGHGYRAIAVFSYPSNFSLGSKEFRLSLCDVDGNCATAPIRKPKKVRKPKKGNASFWSQTSALPMRVYSAIDLRDYQLDITPP